MLTKRSSLSVQSRLRNLTLDNIRLRKTHRRAEEQEQLLSRIAGHLHETLDLDELIGRIFDEVNKAILAQAQSIWLIDAEAGTIVCKFATGPGAEQVTGVAVPFGEGIVGTTVSCREAILVADAQQDSRHSRRAQAKTGMITHSLMSVPLVYSGRSIGAIQAINKQSESALFDENDLDILRRIADTAALCIENARLFADLEASYDTTLEALAAALDARDRETEGHSRRVVAYISHLGEMAGMSPPEVRRLRRGALIHDLGKIGIPDAILRKPGSLTKEEWAVMAQHPEIGYTMLRGISHLRDELDIVRSHHERWDGAGYPNGLAGTEIPINARLFAIIDTYDALTSERYYRAAGTHEDAIRVLSDNAGRQFDPDLVHIFLTVPAEEWASIRANVTAIEVAEVVTAAFAAT